MFACIVGDHRPEFAKASRHEAVGTDSVGLCEIARDGQGACRRQLPVRRIAWRVNWRRIGVTVHTDIVREQAYLRGDRVKHGKRVRFQLGSARVEQVRARKSDDYAVTIDPDRHVWGLAGAIDYRLKLVLQAAYLRYLGIGDQVVHGWHWLGGAGDDRRRWR